MSVLLILFAPYSNGLVTTFPNPTSSLLGMPFARISITIRDASAIAADLQSPRTNEMLDWMVAGGQEKRESADERLPVLILLMAECKDKASNVFPFSRAAAISSKHADSPSDPSFVPEMSSSASPELDTAKIFLASVPCLDIQDSS